MARSYRAPLASRVVGAKRTGEPSIRARKRSERDDATSLGEALKEESVTKEGGKGRGKPVATFVPVQVGGGRAKMVPVPPEIAEVIKKPKRAPASRLGGAPRGGIPGVEF